MSNELVVVTGASGFIAQHCLLELLRAGYRVRGTVRNQARTVHLAHTLERLSNGRGHLEFVMADLEQDDGWDAVMAGAQFVLHVASPIPGAPPKDENELIRPARDGTLRVLRAAKRAGVRRVVLTSSIAAIAHGHPQDDTKVFDERDWSDASQPIGAYEKSKTLAERAAWDFVESSAGGPELVVINPGYVFGPILDKHVSLSVSVVRRLLTSDVPGCPRLHLSCVDVRDVAALHVLALTKPEAAGQRFVCSGESAWVIDIARILKRHFGPRGYRVPTRQVPDWLVHVVALFDRSARLILKELGKPSVFSHERATRTFGWQPRGIEEIFVATGESLIDHGVI